MTCPGQVGGWRSRLSSHGIPVVQVRFPVSVCWPCPDVQTCASPKAGRAGRSCRERRTRSTPSRIETAVDQVGVEQSTRTSHLPHPCLIKSLTPTRQSSPVDVLTMTQATGKSGGTVVCLVQEPIPVSSLQRARSSIGYRIVSFALRRLGPLRVEGGASRVLRPKCAEWPGWRYRRLPIGTATRTAQPGPRDVGRLHVAGRPRTPGSDLCVSGLMRRHHQAAAG